MERPNAFITELTSWLVKVYRSGNPDNLMDTEEVAPIQGRPPLGNLTRTRGTLLHLVLRRGKLYSFHYLIHLESPRIYPDFANPPTSPLPREPLFITTGV